MPEIYYQGIWRMDWGLGNPNKTAALIAIIMISIWTLAYLRRWGFWVALCIFTALGGCLVHTFSRGGVVALIAGVAVLLCWAPRPWGKVRTFAITVSISAVVCYSFFLSAHDRYLQGVGTKDESISNRLEVWQHASAMISDAPGGWGYGKAGHAYMNWYQPVDRLESYRTLVNSHLTWLVEFGWLFRFFYIVSWLGIFTLCWPSHNSPWLSVPFGAWFSFAVAAVFSSVAESPLLWVPPALLLLVTLGYRAWRRDWPNYRLLLAFPMASATAICLFFALTGMRGSEVYYEDGIVTVGSGKSAIWVVNDEKTLGKVSGRTLRFYLTKNPVSGKIMIVESISDLPVQLEGETVVVPGKVESSDVDELQALVEKAGSVVLLSPSFHPQDAQLTGDKEGAIRAYFGEFSQSQYLIAWQNTGSVERVVGAGDYFPSWPAIVLKAVHHQQ